MKRAQITMESLLLYGAAILVVLLAIAALTYFGVFDLGNLLPQKCNMEDTQLFKCEEYQIKMPSSGSEVSIVVKNIASKPIELQSTTFASEESGLITCSAGTFSPSAIITPGKSATLEFDCDGAGNFNVGAGDKVKGRVTVVSKYAGGSLTTTTYGTVTAKVNPP